MRFWTFPTQATIAYLARGDTVMVIAREAPQTTIGPMAANPIWELKSQVAMTTCIVFAQSSWIPLVALIIAST